MIRELEFANIKLKNNLILAPMAGITDLAFRTICKEKNAGLTITEMISIKGLHYKNKKTNAMLKIADNEVPSAIQLFGRDPDICAEVAKGLDFDIIDFNCGCPAPKIVKNNEGSALLKEPKLIHQIVSKLVESTKKPVSVKIRTGLDNSTINAVEIGKIIEDAGASLISIHGRTRAGLYSGEVDKETIAKLVESVKIPVIANGNITDSKSLKEMYCITKAAGFMIGRASFGYPWIFEKLLYEFHENKKYQEPTIKEKMDTAKKHFTLLINDKGERTALSEMRKHFAYYLRFENDSSSLRRELMACPTANGLFSLMELYSQF